MRIASFMMVVLLLGMLCAPATATEGSGISWAFHETRFQQNDNYGRTAVAMRDGQTWPVIFMGNVGQIQALSLYPVENPYRHTNWHLIGENLMPLANNQILSAATSPDGRFGVALRELGGGTNSMAIVASSWSGFGAPLSDVHAIDFDVDGNLVTLTDTTVPGLSSPPVDIATSPLGDVGVVTEDLIYYQNSPLLGGWYSQELEPGGASVLPHSVDLALDASRRPHVLGLADTGSGCELRAYDYNIMNDQWQTNVVDTFASMSGMMKASVAADSTGRVGAAWVNNGTLKYAYKESNDPWTTMIVATEVEEAGGGFVSLMPSQAPGLTFDANDLPVISFVDAGNKIWLAYDPPVSVPEPGAWILLIGGCLALLGRRLAG